MSIFLFACLLSCEEPEVRAERCTGPLNRLVKWRDEAESDRIFRRKNPTPAEMATQERQHVDEVVATLSKQPDCASVWRMMLLQNPDTPATRLQEETVLQLLGEAPHDYDVTVVGWAGVTVAGHPPSGAP